MNQRSRYYKIAGKDIVRRASSLDAKFIKSIVEGKIVYQGQGDPILVVFKRAFDNDFDWSMEDVYELYQNGDAKLRSVINYIFIQLCGRSLMTLAREAKRLVTEKGKTAA